MSVQLDPRTLAGSSARVLGAYYTPPAAVRFMADWAIRTGAERVIEPSVGAGDFIVASQQVALSRGGPALDAWAVELAADTHAALVAQALLPPNRVIHADFMTLSPFPVDVVIGNPPFVRLRHLPPAEAARARTRAQQGLGRPMDADGSLWMPFLLHAIEFLSAGGRLALVLPYEATHVRYARPIWELLGRRFGSLRVIRTRKRVFPDLLQDVVILLADGKGGTSDAVRYETYESPDALRSGSLARAVDIRIDQIAEGARPFVHALLPGDIGQLLKDRVLPATSSVTRWASFNIGYVCGDKRYFHPSEDVIAVHHLPATSMIPAVASGRTAKGHGLHTSALASRARTALFRPSGDPAVHGTGEAAYIHHGERTGVAGRYKCRIRDPWYVTPDVRIPDLILPVFAQCPLLLVNDAALAASNSFLVGRVREGTPEAFAASWYTSLTLLQVELNVHSLGGGVLVMIPGEMRSVRIVPPAGSTDLGPIDSSIRRGDMDGAYRAGDEGVLGVRLGLASEHVDAIRQGVAILRSWRSERADEIVSVEDVPEQQSLFEGSDESVHERIKSHVQIGD